MKRTRTAWILLAAGSVFFAACQSNNKPVSYRADTAAAVTVNNLDTSPTPAVANALPANTAPDVSGASNGLAGNTANGTGASTEATWTGNKNTGGTNAGSTSDMICVPRRAHHRTVAYSSRKTVYHGRKYHRKNTKGCTTETETSVATVEPIKEQPAPEALETPIVTPTPSTDVTYEKRTEFTGNVPVAKKRSKVHLGIEAGGNLNNLYRRSEDFQGSNELKVGFNAGLMMNVELGKHVSFEPGVRYIMKGGELTSTSTDGVFTSEYKDKLTFHYIEMPLNIVYNSGVWGTNSFMIGAGPYVSYLANAQDKTKDKISGPDGTVVETGQHSVPVGDPTNAGHLRSYDIGAGGFIGYQMRSGVYVKGGAEMGFMDLERNPNTLGDFNNRNYNFLLTVGYKCGYKK